MKKLPLLLAALGSASAYVAIAQDPGPSLRLSKGRNAPASVEYENAIARTANMVGDGAARGLAERYGFDVLNVTWEDTGRYKGSSVGPNISDMTIQVGWRDASGQFRVTAMPVIRFPNFSDKTADIDPREFTLLVGNERGRRLTRVSLYEFLASPDRFLSNPDSWRSRTRSLLAPRDEKVLVSAQACFLPIPKQGIATFNPVVFNYQSERNNPAVLTILATREGTSTTIIDNVRDPFEPGAVWGQRLFHNQNGMRASLTGQRQSDVRAGGSNGSSGNSLSGSNMVLLIQVPLKHREPRRAYYDMAPGSGGGGFSGGAMKAEGRSSDVENAVIGHGAFEGVFTEMDNLAVERDPNFPVRVTVQFYKATSNGVVDDKDLAAIRQDIETVYEQGDAVGSLVTDGSTGRVTEYYGPKVQPPGWWEDFWRRYERNQGVSRIEAIRRLRQILGNDYDSRPVTPLYLLDCLRPLKRTR